MREIGREGRRRRREKTDRVSELETRKLDDGLKINNVNLIRVPNIGRVPIHLLTFIKTVLINVLLYDKSIQTPIGLQPINA